MREDYYLVKIWEGIAIPHFYSTVILCSPPMVKNRILKQQVPLLYLLDTWAA
jgi:hypothetical protein